MMTVYISMYVRNNYNCLIFLFWYVIRLEVMHTKLLGMQARLEDNRSHEELMTSKFNALCKNIEDMKLVTSSGKGGDVVGLSAEVDKLKKEVKSLNNQVLRMQFTMMPYMYLHNKGTDNKIICVWSS